MTLARAIVAAALAGMAIIAALLAAIVFCSGALLAGLAYRCARAISRGLRRLMEAVR